LKLVGSRFFNDRIPIGLSVSFLAAEHYRRLNPASAGQRMQGVVEINPATILAILIGYATISRV
jgi:hypothetical protein